MIKEKTKAGHAFVLKSDCSRNMNVTKVNFIELATSSPIELAMELKLITSVPPNCQNCDEAMSLIKNEKGDFLNFSISYL